MFNPLTNELHKNEQISIIIIWKLLYPYIKKYTNHPYNNYHFFNDMTEQFVRIFFFKINN